MEYADIFSKKVAAELLKHTKINNNRIDLKIGKKLPYGPIYSLRPMELEMLKTYIKENLKNSFIRLLKSLTRGLILFVKKSNCSLRLCIDN